MRLSALHLVNFKAFRDQDFRVGRLTVLLGANSAGKSSVIQAILAALQSDAFPLLLSVNGEYVNLGDFRSVSHGHLLSHRIGINLSFSGHALGDVSVSSEYGPAARSRMPVLLSAEYKDVAFRAKIIGGDRSKAEWTYSAPKDSYGRSLKKMKGMREFYIAMNRFVQGTGTLEANKKHSKTKPSFVDPAAAPPPSGSFAFSSPKDFATATRKYPSMALNHHLVGVTGVTREYAQRFNYIGSFREEPQRTYYQVARSDLKIGHSGNNYIDQLASWSDTRAPELDRLKRALRRLALLRDIRPRRLGGGRFEVRVRPEMGSVPASLTDVGFGISQLLPVLVADHQLATNAALAVSQPELHLHPRVQASLADYFIDGVLRSQKQYILETHSEYLLTRLRLRIAEERLSTEDASVYYIAQEKGSARVYPIFLRKDGRIEGAPKHFFDTYMVDTMNLAMAATK